jgi:hypothetical protein
LFDTPADAATPDAAMPADDAGGLGDLFDTPADSATPDAAMPADDAGGLGDLFDTPADSATPDAAMPADDGALDGLFDTPSEPATPDAAPAEEGSGLDDIFGGSSPIEPVEGGALDDLFSQTRGVDQKTVATPVEMIQTPAAKTVVQPANVLDETTTRQWVDNTGTFRTEGRLIKIADDHIKLLKSNGKTCTVPMDRLSDEDSEYVRQIAKRMDVFIVAMAGK